MKLEKIGVQLYTVRDYMNTKDDIKETFKKLKALGYDQVQTAGCKIPYDEFGAIAKESGLEIVGTHDSFELMCTDFNTSLENHKKLGTLNMGIGGYFKPTIEKNITFIEKANMVAEKIAAHGGKFTYHNHHEEFIVLENGKTTMDMLVEGLNPEGTSFVLDTFWVQKGGSDVRYWIEKLSGRIDILHLKDMKVQMNESVFEQVFAEIGNGNLYWEGILETALNTGVKYFVVEQDKCSENPFKSLEISSNYLHKNFM